jgi:cytochrome P450
MTDVASTSADRHPSAPESLLGISDQDPVPVYERLRSECPVGFDATSSSWLVSSFSACREVLIADNTTFRHVDTVADPQMVALTGGPRRLKFLEGDDHRALHRWWLRAFSTSAVVALKESLIRPIVDATIDRFIESGRAELWTDLALRIPVRAVAGLMALPYDDDDWVDTISHELDVWAELFNQRFTADDSVRERAVVASEKIIAMILPAIRARQGVPGSDMISRLWAEGPDLLPDWSENDVVANTHNLLVAGKDTTSLAIANALYLLLTDSAVRARLIEDPQLVDLFVEEALRLFPPVQFRVRVANEPADISGCHIEPGDTVVPILASGNRDEQWWGPDADTVDLQRLRGRTHLTFSHGPRSCVGAAFARAEVQEVVRAVLRRMPDVELDPNGAPAEYTGMVLRAHRPLATLFTPGPKISES